MMRRLEQTAVFLLLCAAAWCAGCAAPEIERGVDAYYKRDYPGAVSLLESGLRTEENRGWYSPRAWFRNSGSVDRGRITVRVARIKAADAHAETGYLHYLDGNMKLAQEEMRKARDYDPSNTLALNLLSQTTWQGDIAGERISKAQELAEGRAWDHAIAELEAILYLTPTYPTIAELHRRCKRSSFALHFDQGKQYFESHAYDKSVEEFKMALARDPESAACFAWYEKSLDHRRAAERCTTARTLQDAGNYEEAYAAYGRALDHVPSFAAALEGQKAARDKWVDAMLDRAWGLHRAGGKADCADAHQLIQRCNELYPGHQAVGALGPRVARRLAEIYAAEATELLGVPGGARIATAWHAARAAHELDPTVPGVPELLATSTTLLDAATTRFVTLACEGPEHLARQVEQEVAARMQALGIGRLAFDVGPGNHLLERTKERLAQSDGAPGVPLAEITVAARVAANSGRKYTLGERTASRGREYIGEKSIRNTEWERASDEYQKNVEKLAGLQAIHRDRRAAYEAAGLERNKADTEYEAARTKHALVGELRRSHTLRGDLWKKRGLTNGANNEFESYKGLEDHAGLAASGKERAQRARDKAHDALRTCTRDLDGVTGSLREVEAALAEQLRYVDLERPQKLEPQYEAYELFSEDRACSAEVAIESEIVSDGEVLSKPMVRLANSRKATVITGARVADTTGAANQPDPLPPKDVFLAGLEQRAVAAYLEQLVAFFSQEHRGWFDKAQAAEKRGDVPAALEYYIRYMNIDGGKTQQPYRLAAEFVDRQMKKPLAAAKEQ